MNLTPPKTSRHLLYLISVFIVGIFLLISTNFYFKYLMESIEHQANNLKTKVELGKFLLSDIDEIKVSFYEMRLTSTNKNSKNISVQKINSKIQQIQQILNVLNKGGTLTRKIKLNLVNHNEINKNIIYEKKNKETLSLEYITLSPKLVQIKEMLKKINIFLQKDSIKNKRYLKLFYKSIPSFFNRMEENTNRLFFETSRQLKSLENDIEKQKKYYTKIEFLLTIAILFIVIFIGSIISMQINNNTNKLVLQEASSRAILDGQPNIVVVSNGQYMIDGNEALVDFFDGYDSFQDFQKEHRCICDFFENMNKEDYLIEKDENGIIWYENIFDNPHKNYKVAMYSGKQLRHFAITAKKEDLDKDSYVIIVVLNDITKQVNVQTQLENLNNNLESIIKDKTKKLKDINETLKHRVQEEVAKNRKKDRQLIIQSRFASLGEMIGNIAHQWRQPLSIISTIASSVKINIELDMSTNDDIKKSSENIIKQVNYLSNTIDDFRTFFVNKKDKTIFNVVNTLNNCLSLIEASYNNFNIEIILDYDKNKEYNCLGISNELLQVYINILNNSKDILKELEINKKIVKIKIEEDENNLLIKINDNAGGIPKDVINKIFDPYFTTKHQSHGTGIGLYMSKEIIQKHMNGEIEAKNEEFMLNDILYKGALFTIQLPKI